MDYDYNDRKHASVYSRRLKAGKRRTYFFDIRQTKGNDFFLTITESRKKFNDDGYERHKIFVYKEDFNKFQKALIDSIDFVKTELMPDFDFDYFCHDGESSDGYQGHSQAREENYVNNASQSRRSTEATEQKEELEVQAKTPSEEAVDEPEVMNVSATSSKLASEEVDKW